MHETKYKKLESSFFTEIKRGNVSKLKRLLDKKVSINTLDEHHQSALIVILHEIRYAYDLKNSFYLPLIQFLLATPNFNLDIQESWTYDTALICAVRYKNIPIIQLLLAANASVGIKNWQQFTAIDYAAEDDTKELSSILKNHIHQLDTLIKNDIENHIANKQDEEAVGTAVAFDIAQIIRGYL